MNHLVESSSFEYGCLVSIMITTRNWIISLFRCSQLGTLFELQLQYLVHKCIAMTLAHELYAITLGNVELLTSSERNEVNENRILIHMRKIFVSSITEKKTRARDLIEQCMSLVSIIIQILRKPVHEDLELHLLKHSTQFL